MTATARTRMASGNRDVPANGHELADLVRLRCDSDWLGPDGRLPTERALADEFGVTRTVVRHALAMLEAEGRITREVGRGTFLRRSEVTGGVLPQWPRSGAAEVSPADVMAARRVIEPRVLPLVVAWATQRDFQEMDRCLERGAAAGSAAEFEMWDIALHHAIVAASRNPLLMAMYQVVERAREGEIWGNLKLRDDSRERRRTYQADHLEVVGALRAREGEHAIRAMEVHLLRVEGNLLEAGASRTRT